ncbi:MFS transporter [Effusibacillus lacus]|uniref:MFS transporter n=1 Tax=Effusibacillus lacus TaxID=1348429 RepID=A0A292YN03_9BACL|nr:MFS transporter [Effusibacillus lacus]TCS71628.1 putative MFS transporter [Effusibacillus lacus]GAX90133.1 MFS transporter [Effusibacillus lacus]
MSTLAGTAPTYRKLLWIAGIGWLFDAMDVGLASFVFAALKVDWKLAPEQISWLGSINGIGMAVGALLAGVMADRIGRKPIFILTLLMFSMASGLSALATGFAMLALLRFLIGMGLGGELPVASTLVSESVPAGERGKVVVLLESFWAGGWILSALVGFYVIPKYGWQVAMLVGAVPALYAVYLRWSLPDSPRLQAPAMRERRSVWQNMTAVWSREYARRTFMLWILWFCVVFSYYGIFLWLPTVMTMKGFGLIKSFQYVLIMTLAQLPGYFSAAWLIERMGRKFVLVTYLAATAISAYAFGYATSIAGLLTAGILLSFFNLGAWGALYAYTPEQYPTRFRTTGAGMAAAFGRVGGILGPLVIGYLAAAKVSFPVIFGIFFGVTLVGALAVLVLGRETRAEELVD